MDFAEQQGLLYRVGENLYAIENFQVCLSRDAVTALWQNSFANCEVHHTQKLNFTLAMW